MKGKGNMMKKFFHIFLFVLIAVLPLFCFFVPKVQATATTVCVPNDSGEVYYSKASYPPYTTGTLSKTFVNSTSYVGQTHVGSYESYRAYYSFYTSVLADDVTVTSAVLEMAIAIDESINREFNISVFSGVNQFSSSATLDWADCTTSEGIWRDTTGISVNTMYNMTILTTSISLTGNTQFRLVTSREGSSPGVEDTDPETILMANPEDSNIHPHLYVTFTSPNTAPIIGAASGTNWDDTDNLYAQKKSYTCSITYTDTDGYADIHYVELYLQSSANATRAQFQYHEDDNSVSTITGGTAWTLDSAAGDFSRSGNDIVASWKFSAQWDATEESDLDFLFYVVDASAASASSTSDQNFDVVTRLTTSGLTSDDGRINKGGTTTISGTVYYANAPAGSTSSSSYPPDAEFTSVSIHDAAHSVAATDSTIVNGAFSSAFAIPNSVQTNTYHVYVNMADADYTDGDAADGDTTAVIGDALTVSIVVGNRHLNVNTNASISVSGVYQFDSSAFDGTLTLNYTTYVESSAQRQDYTVASASGGTYGISTIGTNDDDYVVWDNLVVYNLQSVQYIGSGQYRYQAQIKWGYNSSVINGAAVNVSNPSGVSFSSLASNSTGWVNFVIAQTNGTVGTFTIFGVNDNGGITVAGSNQTFALLNWNLVAQDHDGNTLSGTSVVVKSGTTSVWSGSPSNIFIPSASFSVTLSWYGFTVNTTSTIASQTGTDNFNCSAYPYVKASTRYWVGTDSTVSSVTFTSDLLVVKFSGSTATYSLVATCSQRPSYVLNCSYNYDVDWTTYLTLTHYGNTTVSIAYYSWSDTYIQKVSSARMTAVAWVSDTLNMDFEGTTGDTGTVIINCGGRGSPAASTGWDTAIYSGGTKDFTCTMVFASTISGSVSWTSSGHGGITGTTGTTYIPSTNLIRADFSTAILKQGEKKQITGSVIWTGPTIVYVYGLSFAKTDQAEWFSVDNLPIMLTRSDMQGEGSFPVTLTVPQNLPAGAYNIPCTLLMRTDTSQDFSADSVISFILAQAAVPPGPAPELLTVLFLAGFAVILLAALLRSSSSPIRRRK